jgi:hypothetical protein
METADLIALRDGIDAAFLILGAVAGVCLLIVAVWLALKANA